MTKEEMDMIWKQQVKDWLGNVCEECQGEKNKGRLQRLKDFICEKEESKRRVELKMDYDRLVEKSYQKKR
jgi:hypothetical protein